MYAIRSYYELTEAKPLSDSQITAQTESVFSAYLRKYNQRKQEHHASDKPVNETIDDDTPENIEILEPEEDKKEAKSFRHPVISSEEKAKTISDLTKEKDTRAPIVIVGMGAIGCFLAAHFCNAGKRVICFADPVSLKRIDTEGIYIRTPSLVEKNYRPETAFILNQKPELVFITSKSNP